MSVAHRPDEKPGRSLRGLMTFTLRGMPELDLFENSDSREQALREIEGEAGNPRSGAFWSGVLLLGGSVLIVVLTSRWILSSLAIRPSIRELLQFVIGVTAFWFVLRWLHRSNVGPALREKLLARGVPLCLRCGYALRGHPAEAQRCPECGGEIDPRVRELLNRSGTRPLPP